ncbi:aquaporin family protein [Domibacillus sp. A3M-37]|uniref:MIP/aquaporin family protein n=1 Tax=Domibacillus sp. A3M-37 TaxID=2962037 RepID=UPI0020B864F8|nr:MIP/aquaporin family protein [Domibacillus sp. A3M-37]MCP3762073.1 aquaporin family protein [Domibacillus sp. A3M-37]
MTPFMGELIGTAMLIIFGAGVCANTNLKKSFANGGGWIVIAFGWGLAVTMAVYAVGSVSGAHLNPAVTIALAITGSFPWSDVVSYVTAQMIGAIIGSAVVFLHFLPHWEETEDPGAKLGVFATSPAIDRPYANIISEVIGTFILIIGLLTIGANEFTDGLNPLIVGFLIIAIGLSLGGTTGYAINPARDLGPRIAHFLLPIAGKGGSNWKYAWIPVAGPVIGAVLAAFFYKGFFLNEGTGAFYITLAASIVSIMLIKFVSSGTAVQAYTHK